MFPQFQCWLAVSLENTFLESQYVLVFASHTNPLIIASSETVLHQTKQRFLRRLCILDVELDPNTLARTPVTTRPSCGPAASTAGGQWPLLEAGGPWPAPRPPSTGCRGVSGAARRDQPLRGRLPLPAAGHGTRCHQ